MRQGGDDVRTVQIGGFAGASNLFVGESDGDLYGSCAVYEYLYVRTVSFVCESGGTSGKRADCLYAGYPCSMGGAQSNGDARQEESIVKHQHVSLHIGIGNDFHHRPGADENEGGVINDARNI